MKQKGSASKSQAAADSGTWFDKLTPMKKDLVCVAGLLVIIYLIFFQVIFPGYIFSNESDSASQESWSSAMTHISTTENVEPLWVPYIFCGMPVFGPLLFPRESNYVEILFRIVCKVFFPAANPWFVPHIFLAGLGMFMLARYLGFASLPSLFSAIVLMLNPYFMGLPQSGHGSKLAVFSLLPFVFLALLKLLETRKLIYLGFLAGAMGWMHLLRHPQIAFYILLACGLYLLYDVVADVKGRNLGRAGGKVILFGLAVAISFAIYAYEFLPTQEYAKFSIRGGSGDGKVSSGLTYDYATNWSLHPFEMATYVIPSFFGFSSGYVTDWNGEERALPLYWGWMPFTDAPPYVGLLPVILAIIALIYRRNAMTWFLALLSAVVFMISFGKNFGLLYNLFFYYVPFFNKFRAPSMILYLIPFTFGLLAAYGMTFLLDAEARSKEVDSAKLRKQLMNLIWILAGALVLGFIARGAIYSFLSSFMFVKAGDLQSYGQQVLAVFKEKRFDLLWSDFVKMAIIAGAFLYATVMALDRKISRSTFSGACIAITIIDLLILDLRFISPKPPSAMTESFQPDPTVQFLKQDSSLARVFPLGDLFQDNTYMYHFVTSLGGYSPAKLKIYQELVDSTFYHGSDPKFPVNMNVANMLNAKYLLAHGRLPEGRWKLVSTDQAKGVLTYENPDYLPRAWFAERVVVANSHAEVFARMNDPAWNPGKTAILEKSPGPIPEGPDSASARIEKYGSQGFSVATRSSRSALLVVSEVYYPAGWRAYIDGAPAEIFKTNYVIRSVVVPAGNHTVEFRFVPDSYETGFRASQAGWAIALLLIIGGAFQLPAVRSRLGMGGGKSGAKPEPAGPAAIK